MAYFIDSILSEPRYQFKVQQSWRKPVRNAVGGIGEVFDKKVRNGIGPVNQVKYFQRCPNVFKTFEWAVRTAFTAVVIQQQCTEANVYPDIRVD